MNDVYQIVMLIASLALAFITSVRIAYVLSGRWKFKNEGTFFFCASTGIASAVCMGFISFAMSSYGGNLFGLASVIVSVPLVGVAWLFIVGANKALERIIGSLLSKVS